MGYWHHLHLSGLTMPNQRDQIILWEGVVHQLPQVCSSPPAAIRSTLQSFKNTCQFLAVILCRVCDRSEGHGACSEENSKNKRLKIQIQHHQKSRQPSNRLLSRESLPCFLQEGTRKVSAAFQESKCTPSLSQKHLHHVWAYFVCDLLQLQHQVDLSRVGIFHPNFFSIHFHKTHK